MIGPLLTQKVHGILRAAARSGAPTVECSLDLERSRTTVEVGAAGWTWQGQRFPYLETCKDRTVYHWIGETFQPIARFTTSLIKLVPTEWGPPTFEIDGIKTDVHALIRWENRNFLGGLRSDMNGTKAQSVVSVPFTTGQNMRLAAGAKASIVDGVRGNRWITS